MPWKTSWGLWSSPGRWILIAETTSTASLLAGAGFEDGSLVTETVSNFYLEGEDCWTPEQESRLHALGWSVRSRERPNWIKVEYTTRHPSMRLQEDFDDTEGSVRTGSQRRSLREAHGGAHPCPGHRAIGRSSRGSPASSDRPSARGASAWRSPRGPKLLKAFDDLGKERRAGGHLGWFGRRVCSCARTWPPRPGSHGGLRSPPLHG